MKIRYAGSTDVGLKRTRNEDNFFVLEEDNLYVVADGMGGHSYGEVASKIAVETLANFFIDTARDKEGTWPFREDKELNYDENRLVTGIKLANRRVYETAQSDRRLKDMGTTLVGLLAVQSGAYVGHVGDSRAYRIRDGEIIQLTEDHTFLNEYMKLHDLTPDEIEAFPQKNVILRAIGIKEEVTVDIIRLEPKPGDVYLLCSDGLSGMISDPDINEQIKRSEGDLARACELLITAANENGGADNITTVLVGFYP